MSKEKLLRDLQDLVLTLRSSNVEDKRVQDLWSKKRDLVLEEVKDLTREDNLWLDVEYKKWHNEHVMPYVDETLKSISEDDVFEELY